MRSERFLKPLVSIAASLMVILFWQYASTSGLVNKVLLPPPSAIIPKIVSLVTTGELFRPLGFTLSLLFISFVIASVLGIGLGVLMGTSRALYLFFEPVMESIRPIPKVALVAPMFLLFGIGYKTMLIIAVLAQFFPILINTIQGAHGVDPVLLNTARTFRISRTATIFKIIIPNASPMIFAGLRVAIGIGLVLAIMSEMIAGDGGVGFLVLDYERSFETVSMFAWVAVLAMIGLALAYGFDYLERVALPWRGR